MSQRNKFSALLESDDDEPIGPLISDKRDRAATAEIPETPDTSRKSTLSTSSNPTISDMFPVEIPNFYDLENDSAFRTVAKAELPPIRNIAALRDDTRKKISFSKDDSAPFTRKIWCRYGNACVWKNCRFRHEPCAHFAAGRCRTIAEDPDSCKSTFEGGCKYDHRNPSNLREYVDHVEIKSEEDMLEKFPDLIVIGGNQYDACAMDRFQRHLLIRSLKKTKFDFINYHEEAENDYGLYIEIPSESMLNTHQAEFDMPSKEVAEFMAKDMLKDFPYARFGVEERGDQFILFAIWTETK